MKTPAIMVHIEQLAKEIENSINHTTDTDENCRLQDALGKLREAYRFLDGTWNPDIMCDPCSRPDVTLTSNYKAQS